MSVGQSGAQGTLVQGQVWMYSIANEEWTGPYKDPTGKTMALERIGQRRAGTYVPYAGRRRAAGTGGRVHDLTRLLHDSTRPRTRSRRLASLPQPRAARHAGVRSAGPPVPDRRRSACYQTTRAGGMAGYAVWPKAQVWKYKISTNTWITLTATYTDSIGANAAAYDPSNKRIYMTQGKENGGPPGCRTMVSTRWRSIRRRRRSAICPTRRPSRSATQARAWTASSTSRSRSDGSGAGLAASGPTRHPSSSATERR